MYIGNYVVLKNSRKIVLVDFKNQELLNYWFIFENGVGFGGIMKGGVYVFYIRNSEKIQNTLIWTGVVKIPKEFQSPLYKRTCG